MSILAKSNTAQCLTQENKLACKIWSCFSNVNFQPNSLTPFLPPSPSIIKKTFSISLIFCTYIFLNVSVWILEEKQLESTNYNPVIHPLQDEDNFISYKKKNKLNTLMLLMLSYLLSHLAFCHRQHRLNCTHFRVYCTKCSYIIMQLRIKIKNI